MTKNSKTTRRGLTRRQFVALSAVSLGSLALAGCESGKEDEEMDASTQNEEVSEKELDAGAAVEMAEGPAVVMCFSATGNTWGVAERLAEVAECEIQRLEAAEPYTSEDLNYSVDCRANAEQDAGDVRPEIAGGAPDLDSYGTIYLGYPIWWGRAPRIVFTLLESGDFAGKRVVAFCTSGGSGIEESLKELGQAFPNVVWEVGGRFEVDASEDSLRAIL